MDCLTTKPVTEVKVAFTHLKNEKTHLPAERAEAQLRIFELRSGKQTHTVGHTQTCFGRDQSATGNMLDNDFFANDRKAVQKHCSNSHVGIGGWKCFLVIHVDWSVLWHSR